MTRSFISWICAGALLALIATTGRAADATDDGQARLREALRAAMLQLRSLQSDLAAAQSAQGVLTAENQALKARIEASRRDAQHDQEVSAKALAESRATVAKQDRDLIQLRESVQNEENRSRAAAALAAQKETDRAQLASAQLALRRTVEEREAQNRELYRLGLEILRRYEKFSLGEALAAREPFVGTTRTRLENQVQGYEDKLTAQVARP
jgi:NADH dehydrogenase/NADH:ubiquinone oxidoreductase subunit G